MDEHDPISRFRLQRCYHCGYDLRGLASGTCPECGTRVAEAILFPGSRRGLLVALLVTAGVIYVVAMVVSSGPISMWDFSTYASLCIVVVWSWISIPRRGVARDGSGMIVTDQGVTRPINLRYERIPWSHIDSFSLDRSRHTPEMRGAIAFYRCELVIMMAEWPRSQGRWLPAWFERVRTTTVRATLTANEHERELLEQEIRGLRDRGGQCDIS